MKIIYTYTDEAPALATESLLPIIRAFAATAAVEVETRDISLAGRILAQFPDRLGEDQRTLDALTELGELAKTPAANIIKLPNISASVPQLKAAIRELQEQGFDVPDYPDEPVGAEQHDIRARYDRVKGSAVNPVLREGNSDRRAPQSVKEYARRHPHSMGTWSSDSRSHVVTMSEGDFRATELSLTAPVATSVRIEHVSPDGEVTVLKERVALLPGEIIDASVMRAAALSRFLAEQFADARDSGLLYSVHLKATMMKVSDPIIFGHAVRTYFAGVFDRHEADLRQVGVNPNDGLGALLAAIEQLPSDRRDAIRASIEDAYADGPALGDGRLRPWDHQSPRPERRDHRRLDARGDSRLRTDVELHGRAAGHEVRDSRPLLRGVVCGNRRGLQAPWGVRPGDDGNYSERRSDGAGG